MNPTFKHALAIAGVAFAAQALAQVTFYENADFGGRSFTATTAVDNFARYGFNDRASSVVVTRDSWEVCQDAAFNGHCVVLRPGRYASLASMGLDDRVSSVRSVTADARYDEDRYAPPSAGEVTFYENENFGGRSFTANNAVENFARYGFNDRASSVVVTRDRWEVCQDATFNGRCIVLRPGRYPSLASMGLNDRVSSVRSVAADARFDDDRYAPPPVADYRRRDNERLYEAKVTAVHAVLGPPEQRCWIESEPVQQRRGVGGALVGALAGGILGHQIGGGSGKTLMTVGGAVAGAAVGSNIARNRQGQPVEAQHCETVQSQAQPSYWDVTYDFRGQIHHVQLSAPPGQTVTVNQAGEPRG